MAKAKPMIGFILSLIGGLIILIAGALLVMLLLLPGLLGIVWGILIVIFGLLAYMKPNKMYGIIILILALINLIGTFVLFGADFFWIGSILSLLGGILVYIEK